MIMKKSTVTILVMLALCVFRAPSFAAGDMSEKIEFQAEFIEKDNDEVTSGKIYVGDGVSRYETKGGKEIVVTRQDKKVIWLIFPQLSKYVEQSYIGQLQPVFVNPNQSPQDNVTREFLDYEWVNSFRLRKFLVTVHYPQGDDKYYEWHRDNFPVPVKTESLDGRYSFEYQKIKIAQQDPSLFVTPRRYKKVEMEEIIAAENKN